VESDGGLFRASDSQVFSHPVGWDGEGVAGSTAVSLIDRRHVGAMHLARTCCAISKRLEDRVRVCGALADRIVENGVRVTGAKGE